MATVVRDLWIKRWVCLPGLLLFAFAAYADLPALAQAKAAPGLNGIWRAQGQELWLKIDGDQIITLHKNTVQAHSLLSSDSTRLEVLTSGHRESWPYALSDGSLQVTLGSGLHQLQRVTEGPSELDLQPISISPRRPLSSERVAKIVKQLADRMAEDQRLRKENQEPSQIATAVERNTAYLKGLVQEIGWIDVERFGADAAFDAAILAKHSRDLSLMLAALPHIEQDFRKPGDYSQAFAVLYDGVQIRLGKRQRYGTQIGWIEGKPFVLALENPERVDLYRAELGLTSLREYLSSAEQYLGDGEEIGILSY